MNCDSNIIGEYSIKQACTDMIDHVPFILIHPKIRTNHIFANFMIFLVFWDESG
jgi:hypothetical protein